MFLVMGCSSSWGLLSTHIFQNVSSSVKLDDWSNLQVFSGSGQRLSFLCQYPHLRMQIAQAKTEADSTDLREPFWNGWSYHVLLIGELCRFGETIPTRRWRRMLTCFHSKLKEKRDTWSHAVRENWDC